MPKAKQEKIVASGTESAVMLEIIDRRITEFLDVVLSSDAEPYVVEQLGQWTEQTRRELRGAFLDWYTKNIEGTTIPKELVVPKPRKDRIYKTFEKIFAKAACEICRETRVLNIAHIIPRHDGGPDEEWNLMRLCADHHYLFDSGLLNEEEWNSIDWKSKDPRARAYAFEQRLPVHQDGWRTAR